MTLERQLAHSPFQVPDFYDNGTVITIESPENDNARIDIRRMGEASVYVWGRKIRTPEQFHQAFPDGDIPQDDTEDVTWVHNAWFELFRITEDGNEYDTGCIDYSIHDAIAMAWNIITNQQ